MLEKSERLKNFAFLRVFENHQDFVRNRWLNALLKVEEKSKEQEHYKIYRQNKRHS